jgi:hypothetical protein
MLDLHLESRVLIAHDDLLGKIPKKSLDQIEPGSAVGSKMHHWRIFATLKKL